MRPFVRDLEVDAWHDAGVRGEVSVILPTRGGSAHLKFALDSALACPETGEVLLLSAGDDLDPTLFEDARVRRIDRPAGGVSAARNAGLAAARGAYLAFLDDDDAWMPNHLEQALETVRRFPEAVLVGSNAWLFVDKTPDGSLPPPGDTSRLALHRPGAVEETLSLGTLLRGNRITTPAVVLVRTHLRDGDRFDASLSHMEDYDLWLRLARDRQLVYDPRPSVLVRKRPDSASRDRRKMAEGSLEVIDRHLAVRGVAEQITRADLRARRGRLWHELAYACLVEDDVAAGRRAALRSVASSPSLLKSYAYLFATYLPGGARRAAFARGRRR